MEDKKKKWKFSRLLKGLDMFGATPNFRINNKREHKSVFGGITTIFFVFAALAFIAINSKDFITRKNVTLLFTNKILEQDPAINLTDTSYAIGFSLTYEVNTTVPSEEVQKYFDYSFSLIQWLGAGNINKIKVPLKKCEYKDFNSISEDNFVMNGIVNMFCPDLSEGFNFTISGLFTDYWYQYLELEISLKPELLEDSSDLKKLMYENPLQATIFFIDTGINYDNMTHPLPSLVNYHYTSVSLLTNKIVEVFLSTLEFRSDKNILFPNPDYSMDTMLDKITEYSIETPERKLMNPDYSLGIAKFILKCSSKYYIVSRSYQKIPDFLANMSGLISQVLFILMFVLSYTNRKSADHKIMANVLKYKGKKNFDIKYLAELFSTSKQNEGQEIKNVRKSINLNNDKWKFNDFLIEDNKELQCSNGSLKSRKNSVFINNNEIDDKEEDEQLQTNSKGKHIYNKNVLKMNQPSKNNTVFLPKVVNYSHISEIKSMSLSPENYDINGGPTHTELGNNHIQLITPVNRLLSESKTRSSLLNKRKRISRQTTKFFLDTPVRKKDLEVSSKDLNDVNEKLFELNSIEIILMKMKCCCKRFKNRKRIIKAGQKKMYFYLDVMTYLKKMQEIDILKYIILSADQLYLFNFLSRPPISTNDISSQVYKEFELEQKRSIGLNKEEIKQMHECYYNILTTQDLNIQDKKLLNLIDAEIEGIKI